MRNNTNYISVFFLAMLLSTLAFAQEIKHPHVILTQKAVADIRAELGKNEILDNSFNSLKSEIDRGIKKPIDVPIPKDPAGGYTHNQHKDNYLNMYGAGVLYQLTQDKAYAEYVKKVLLAYAEMYPSLGLHPIKKSDTPGKLFWQALNDAVWMVYTSQAYDCVYDYLSAKERKKIEQDLLLPYANFLSVETPEVFNKIHNHGVWAVAAVGMVGFATDNNELVQLAFNGIENYPNETHQKAGFLTQVRELFSPDGYYTEGPYYQRYALLPYMLFAQAIENNKPEMKIFEYQDKVLQKAVKTTLQLSNTNGQFFPLNDAMKGMSYLATELVTATDIVFGQNPQDYSLLAIAEEQKTVILSEAGLKVAKAIAEKKTQPFVWKSAEFRDGNLGNQGALGVLRSGTGKGEQAIIMEYASQGMGHGHFDRLGIFYYDNENEILQDYGSARYVNVEHKQGGRYLPENETWAKQTIAHNTVTVDSTSHFGGKFKEADKFHADSYFFDISTPEIQIMSAKENNAYEGVKMQRTIALIKNKELFNNSIIVDIFRLESEVEHTYDLSYYYQGQFMHTNIDYKAFTTSRKALGTKDGYQHLWLEAEGKSTEKMFSLNWLNDYKFYSLVSEVNDNSQMLFTRIGATDPEFNLRNEPAVIIRQKAKNHVFASVIESHGSSNPTTELTQNLSSTVNKIETIYNEKDYTLVEITTVLGKKISLAISNNTSDKTKKHQLKIGSKEYTWTGAFHLFVK